MESRLRFLHLMQTELWGRRRGTRAGNGKTGPSAAAGQLEKPLSKGMALRGANLRVAKRARSLPGKAAIVLYQPVP